MPAAFTLKVKVKEPDCRGKSDQTDDKSNGKKDDQRVVHCINPKDSRGAVAHVGEDALKKPRGPGWRIGLHGDASYSHPLALCLDDSLNHVREIRHHV